MHIQLVSQPAKPVQGHETRCILKCFILTSSWDMRLHAAAGLAGLDSLVNNSNIFCGGRKTKHPIKDYFGLLVHQSICCSLELFRGSFRLVAWRCRRRFGSKRQRGEEREKSRRCKVIDFINRLVACNGCAMMKKFSVHRRLRSRSDYALPHSKAKVTRVWEIYESK